MFEVVGTFATPGDVAVSMSVSSSAMFWLERRTRLPKTKSENDMKLCLAVRQNENTKNAKVQKMSEFENLVSQMTHARVQWFVFLPLKPRTDAAQFFARVCLLVVCAYYYALSESLNIYTQMFKCL